MPATIVPIVAETSLPRTPAAGADELWLIQVPGDMDIDDLHGLRFKLTGEGGGVDMASLKAAGEPGSQPSLTPIPPATRGATSSARECV